IIHYLLCFIICVFFSSRRRHTRSKRDWSSDVCSSDLQNDFFNDKIGFVILGGNMMRVIKRNGHTVDFDATKIENAILKAMKCGRSEERRVGKEWRSRR